MFDSVIAQDCVEMYNKENRIVVIADGKVVGFGEEPQSRADKLPGWKQTVMNRSMCKK